jgi:protein-tyrosine phosphatase
VLVEFQTDSSYQVFCRAIKEFRDAGYIPIVAHVERYGCLHDEERLSELKEMGAMIQMNIEAFQGGMFNKESNWAKKCLKKELIDFLASDMHSENRRPPMMGEELRWVQKNLNSEYQKELLYENAQKIWSQSKG